MRKQTRSWSRGKRFESARRLSKIGLDKLNTWHKESSRFGRRRHLDTTQGTAHARGASHKLLLEVAGATMIVSIEQASDLTGPEHHCALCKGWKWVAIATIRPVSREFVSGEPSSVPQTVGSTRQVPRGSVAASRRSLYPRGRPSPDRTSGARRG